MKGFQHRHKQAEANVERLEEEEVCSEYCIRGDIVPMDTRGEGQLIGPNKRPSDGKGAGVS